ncbi:MAG: TraB/GumN family protein [Deltaproteobacteria bacterium]|nr:TraB/GumN family protein [Deltaproteobacteria bacterium]
MTSSDPNPEKILELPGSVRHLTVAGKDIYLVGTAHVSAKSVTEVETTIRTVAPDTVAVELCPPRHQAMTRKEHWQQMDIIKVIKEKKALLLLAQLILSAFYRRLGKQLGVQPGAEMMAGIHEAEAIGAELVLADRPIDITLKRVWGYLGWRQKAKMIFHLLSGVIFSEEIDSEMIEEMLNQDQLENLLSEFTIGFPEVKRRLIDERDIFLAQKLRQAPGRTLVAVVGAGHLEGIIREIEHETPLAPIMEIPPPTAGLKFLKWGLPVLIVALIIAGFFRGGSQHSLESIYIWVFVNGLLAALGAGVAGGHPLTIIAAFFAAPITSLNPLIAAGFVSGLVQASVKKPTVADFENLPQEISTIKGFWRNPVSRILLVVALSNLGSATGTFVSGSWIAVRLF